MGRGLVKGVFGEEGAKKFKEQLTKLKLNDGKSSPKTSDIDDHNLFNQKASQK